MALTNMIRRALGGKGPRLLIVKSVQRLSPNMLRVTFGGDDLEGFPENREGGNCKLLIPTIGETLEDFAQRLTDGPKPVRRTYTVRRYRKDAQELDIDFVAHGDTGPAAAWANRAEPGSFIGFMGPSGPKVTTFDADWYLLAADLSALPVAAATLEAMPREAKGVAVFEVPGEDDRQEIDSPDGVALHWLTQPTPHVPSDVQVDFLESLDVPDGVVQTCIAGESGTVKAVRSVLLRKMKMDKAHTYISGYWKHGLIEDEHQKVKRSLL